jgi:predicted PurR-regulated permease PerM
LANIARLLDTTKHVFDNKAMTSLATGILISAGMALFSVDYAALWGPIAFLLNFIQNF